jgi:hypothetical protein
MLVTKATNSVAACFVSQRRALSGQWLNGTEGLQITAAYSETADSAAALFLLPELTEVHSHQQKKLS